MRAWDILRREYGSSSKNFMTPTVLQVGSIWRGKVAYEISKGKGIRRDRNSPEPDIFGVSIASYDPDLDTTQRYTGGISGCFGSLDAARDHVNFLRENWWMGESDLLDAIARRKVIGG